MDWIRTLAPDNGAWGPRDFAERALGDPALIGRAIEVLGPAAAAWSVQTAHEAATVVREREEQSGFPPSSLIGRDRQASEEAFLRLMISLADGSSTDSIAELPEPLVDIVHAESRHGIPLEALLNRVWGVRSMAKDALISALQEVISPARRSQVLREVSFAMLDYANVFARRVATAYAQEQRAWRTRRATEQLRVLKAVADGATPPSKRDSAIAAAWRGGHIVAVGWADRDEYIADDERDIAQYMAASASSMGAQYSLTLEQDGEIFLWWNFAADLPPKASPAIARLSRPTWLRLAVGPPGTGVAGFRAAWHGAKLTARAGRQATAGSTWHYKDVGHLALMLRDRTSARWFVRQELGPLLDSGSRLAEIRETVRLYLASGHSRVVVADLLHVAPNTVAYRVARASELLGYPVADRAQQILLALQLIDPAPALVVVDVGPGNASRT